MLARCVATVARAFDWGVCEDAAGNYLFRYYSDLSWVVDVTEPVAWLQEERPPGRPMKEYFRFVYGQLAGSSAVVARLCTACAYGHLLVFV